MSESESLLLMKLMTEFIGIWMCLVSNVAERTCTRTCDSNAAFMKIGPWVARKRKAFWEARFAVAVANCKCGSWHLGRADPSHPVLFKFVCPLEYVWASFVE